MTHQTSLRDSSLRQGMEAGISVTGLKCVLCADAWGTSTDEALLLRAVLLTRYARSLALMLGCSAGVLEASAPQARYHHRPWVYRWGAGV